METVVSLIPDDEHVPAVKRALAAAGFTENNMTILRQPVEVWQRLGGRRKMRTVLKKAAVGGLIGIGIGALYGIPAGVFNCVFMNCPQSISLFLWAIITLFWVVASGFLGTIIGLDQLERSLYSYVEGVRRGEALFVIQASPDRVPVAVDILQHKQGTVIHRIHGAMEIR
jgi:hypothetical protein